VINSEDCFPAFVHETGLQDESQSNLSEKTAVARSPERVLFKPSDRSYEVAFGSMPRAILFYTWLSKGLSTMQSFKPVIRWWSLVNPRIIAHFSERLDVLDDRLAYRRGILSKSEVVIPFSRITNYAADQNLFDRIFGVGDFRVETAGSITPELTLIGYKYKLRDILSYALGSE